MTVKRGLIALCIGVFCLVGCSTRSTLPIYRIGIITPLEGNDRPAGLDIFFATRAVMLDALQSDSLGDFRLELVTIDDLAYMGQAAQQAEALAIDPSMLVVIGHVAPDATRAAIPIYHDAGLPLITYALETPANGVFVLDAPADRYDTLTNAYPPEPAITNLLHAQDVDDPVAFAAAIAHSDPSASTPGFYSPIAYDAVSLAIAAIQQASVSGDLSRESVTHALQHMTYNGLTGSITFDAQGYRENAPLFRYATRFATNAEGDPVLLDRLQ